MINRLRKNRITTRCLLVGVATSAVGLSLTVQAIPITGEMDFLGVVTADHGDLTAATHLTFNNTLVGVVLGNYGSLLGSPVAQLPLTFRPITVSPGSPILNFWTLTQGAVTYSFDLDTLTIAAGNSTHFLGLSGTGTAHITGFDDTAATWSLTATTQGSPTFTFAESTATIGGIGGNFGVPDTEATAGLLGGSLGVLGLLRRRLALAI